MRKSKILAAAMAAATLLVVMAAGLTSVGLTEQLRLLGLVMLPAGAVAALLVLYFEWRAKLRRRMLAERHEMVDLDRAA